MSKYMRVTVLVVLALALAALAFAQKAPKYDKTTETKLAKVVIDEVKTVTVNGQERVSLVIKDGAETVEVYVAPKSFLADMSTEFAKGDQVEITGSKVKTEDGTTLMLAREVVKGNNTLVLRDKVGEPVWSWMEKKTAEGK